MELEKVISSMDAKYNGCPIYFHHVTDFIWKVYWPSVLVEQEDGGSEIRVEDRRRCDRSKQRKQGVVIEWVCIADFEKVKNTSSCLEFLMEDLHDMWVCSLQRSQFFQNTFHVTGKIYYTDFCISVILVKEVACLVAWSKGSGLGRSVWPWIQINMTWELIELRESSVKWICWMKNASSEWFAENCSQENRAPKHF